MDALPVRHQRFADGVLAGKSHRQAYLDAGFKPTKTAALDASASKLLSSAKVAAYIAARQRKALAAADVTAERVVREMGRIALFDSRKLYRPDGSLKAPHEWDDDTAAVVASVEVTEEVTRAGDEQEPQPRGGTLTRKKAKVVTRTKKVKVIDKNVQLTNLARMHKLLGADDPPPQPGGAVQVVVKVLGAAKMEEL